MGCFTSLKNRMLLGRLLTRSGDQAWDFAVPIVLLKLLPGQLQVAALYYLLARLAHVLALPRVSRMIDSHGRPAVVRLGIFIQTVGVLIGAITLTGIATLNAHEPSWGRSEFVLLFGIAVLGGLLSSLGSSFMDIAIANDLVPSSMNPDELGHFNSRLRQLDLLTEVTSPILAGLLLLATTESVPLLGFYLIAFWNLVSFAPELALLQSIFRDRPDLRGEKVSMETALRVTLWEKLSFGWHSFFRQPVAGAVFAYALLWLSVLSPHGVLLTAFLKDGWNLPEWEIGVFRGAGALFGLIATLISPPVMKKLGLVRAGGAFLTSQAIFVGLALACFFLPGAWAAYGFLGFILLSRIGLYGFSLGEMEIRQRGITAEVRGEVNGFATALTGVATLALYAAGAALPSTGNFWILAAGSVGFVFAALIVYLIWARTARDK